MQHSHELFGQSEYTVHVLGEFAVGGRNREMVSGTRQIGRLGAVLASSPGVAVSPEALIAALWGDEPPKTAANSLQVHVSHLRDLCGAERIITTSGGYLFDVPIEAIDADWVLRAVPSAEAALSAGDIETANSLAQGVSHLWRGEPYSGIETLTIASSRATLRDRYERCQELQAEIQWQQADTPALRSEAIAFMKGLVVRQPLRERGYELLIRALVSEERLAEAASAYHQAAAILRDQVGVKPSPRLDAAIDGVLV